MEGEILFFVRNNGPTFSIRIEGSSTLEDFKNRLRHKGLSSENVFSDMMFSIPNYPDCTLSNQEEWENMIMLLSITGLKVATIFVGSVDNGACVGNSVAEESMNLPVNNNSTPLLTLTAHNNMHYHEQQLVDSISKISSQNIPFINLPIRNDKTLLSANWASLVHSVGQSFEGGAVDFRIKLAKYSLEKGYKYRFVRNTGKQVIAECKKRDTHDCGWYVNATASSVNGWFYIRTLRNEHTCPLEVRSDKRLSATLISLLIVDKVKADPNLCPKTIQTTFINDYGFEVSYQEAWRSIDKARSFIFGSYTKSFQELNWYLENLERMNPGTHTQMELHDPPSQSFKRMFVSFRASIDGFSHCRPMLFLDGTFLKTRYKGTLLSATAKDGQNGLFPLAFAVVTSEDRDNWKWFLLHLIKIIQPRTDVIYVSDRNVGLMSLFQNEFRNLKHFYCLHHLKTNLRDRFKGKAYSFLFKEKAVALLSECARAPTVSIFDQKVSELKNMGGNIVREFLSGLPVERWAFAHAKCVRFGEMTSNAAESFNKWIKEARSLPIVQMVDLIRAQLMCWFDERRTKADGWTWLLCGGLEKKWNESLKEARCWDVRRCSPYIFEFLCQPTVVVDLDKRNCSCYQWQFHAFPCAHAVAAIHRSDSKIEDFVDPYYHASLYRKCYAGLIVPVATMLKHSEIVENGQTILPPKVKKQLGRLKRKRIPSKGEPPKRQYRCKKCQKFGHNSASCKEPPDS